MKPDLSIIIPTYNRSSILKQCLGYLLVQEGVDFEVIVVDDGSTDDTQEAVESFKSKHLKYIKQANAHQGAARNRGVKEATGEIIVFVDDDIFVQPGFLKHHHDRHIQHSDENVVVLGHSTWDPALDINDYMRFLEASGWQFGYSFLNPGMIGKQPPYQFFYTSNLSIKKAFFLKESFNETFKGYGFEDMELGYRLWKDHDMQLYYEPKASAHHHNLILESDLPKKMRSIGQSAVHFQTLHPEIWALPKGLKKWLIKLATNPITLPFTRLLGQNTHFKFRSWREFWRGAEEKFEQEAKEEN